MEYANVMLATTKIWMVHVPEVSNFFIICKLLIRTLHGERNVSVTFLDFKACYRLWHISDYLKKHWKPVWAFNSLALFWRFITISLCSFQSIFLPKFASDRFLTTYRFMFDCWLNYFSQNSKVNIFLTIDLWIQMSIWIFSP